MVSIDGVNNDIDSMALVRVNVIAMSPLKQICVYFVWLKWSCRLGARLAVSVRGRNLSRVIEAGALEYMTVEN